MTRPRPVGEEAVQEIQVTLKSDAHHASIRSLKVLSGLFVCHTVGVTDRLITLFLVFFFFCPLQSEQVSRLVKVHGIIISATAVKAKATKVCLQCRGCRAVIPNIPLPPGLQGYALPRKCNS